MLKQRIEEYDGMDYFGNALYDDVDRVTKTNAFYFRIAASIFLN